MTSNKIRCAFIPLTSLLRQDKWAINYSLNTVRSKALEMIRVHGPQMKDDMVDGMMSDLIETVEEVKNSCSRDPAVYTDVEEIEKRIKRISKYT